MWPGLGYRVTIIYLAKGLFKPSSGQNWLFRVLASVELYRSCLPSTSRCSRGLQIFSSQASFPCSVKPAHWPTTLLCLTQQRIHNLESVPALCQLWGDRQYLTLHAMRDLIWQRRSATTMLTHHTVHREFELPVGAFVWSVPPISQLQAVLWSWQPRSYLLSQQTTVRTKLTYLLIIFSQLPS